MTLTRISPLTAPDYQRFRDLIVARYGIWFAEDQREDLADRLSRAMRQTGASDLSELYSQLLCGAADVTEILTVGETHFYRNRSQFSALTEVVLPQLIDEARRKDRGLRIWSCGCATGEEPYSLAIALRELLPDADRWNITIMATDLNRAALRRAEQGAYSAWSFREMNPHLRDQYFRRVGDLWLLDPVVKRMVTFAPLNLATSIYPVIDGVEPLDLILCRNVTIYFTEAVTRHVIGKLHGALRTGGWLLVGASEPNLHTYRQFEARTIGGAIFYRKPAEPVPTPQPVQVAAPSPPEVPTPPIALAARVDALVTAERGVVLAPLDPAAHFHLSLVYREQGRNSDAMQELKKTLFLDRQFAAAHYMLGHLYREDGRRPAYTKAFENARAILRLMPRESAMAGMNDTTAGELLALVETQLAEAPAKEANS